MLKPFVAQLFGQVVLLQIRGLTTTEEVRAMHGTRGKSDGAKGLAAEDDERLEGGRGDGRRRGPRDRGQR